jgi:hypothetical protein
VGYKHQSVHCHQECGEFLGENLVVGILEISNISVTVTYASIIVYCEVWYNPKANVAIE